MHKGCIILVKAEDKSEAIEKVNDFMEPYGDGDVWDWFSIGGRWSNTLAPKKLREEWDEIAKNILPKNEHGWLSQDDVDKNQAALQKAWNDLGLKGENPYFNHYKLGSEGSAYDCVPLTECVDTVKEWVKDLGKEADELFEKLTEERQKEKNGDKGTMSAYYAGLYKDATYQNFCFESNVFNLETDEGEKMPEDNEGFFAVMIDMHN